MFEMGGESRYHQISRIRLDGASAHDWVSTTSGSAPFAIPTIYDPDESIFELKTVVDSPLRLVQVPRRLAEIPSSEFTIEVVDNPVLFKYTGENDTDMYFVSEEDDEDEDGQYSDWDY